MPTALTKFTQGINTAPAGIAAVGNLAGGPVIITNGNDSGIDNWTFEILDVPVGSSLSTGVIGSGVTNFASFTPDVSGCYRVRLIVSDLIGNFDVDIRNFGVPNSNGWIIPPYQKNPDPIDLSIKSDELNFNSQGRGWADGVEGLLGYIFNNIDSTNVPDPVTGHLNAILVTKPGTQVLTCPFSFATVGTDIFIGEYNEIYPSGKIFGVDSSDSIISTTLLNVAPIIGAPAPVNPFSLTSNGASIFGSGLSIAFPQVFQFIPTTGVVSAATTPSSIVSIEFISIAASFATGAIYAAIGTDLILIDPTALGTQILTGFPAGAVKYNGVTQVCIVNNDGVTETISIIDTTTELITGAVLTPKNAITGSVTFGGGFFWVLTFNDSTVSQHATITQIDPNGGGPGVPTIFTTFDIGLSAPFGGLTGTYYGDITFDTVNGKIWVLTSDNGLFGTVRRISTIGDTEITLNLQTKLSRIFYSGGFVYAGRFKIDSTNGSVSKSLGVSSSQHYELAYGDQLNLDFAPTNYTSTPIFPLTSNANQLTSHLNGIGSAIGTGRTELTNINEVLPTFPDTISANSNDYPVSSAAWDKARFLTLSATGNFDITGFNISLFDPIVAFGFVRKRHIINSSVFTLTLKHQSASSIAANRIICPSSVDLALGPSDVATIVYDTLAARWRVISFT
jgi:hypothetical protein